VFIYERCMAQAWDAQVNGQSALSPG